MKYSMFIGRWQPWHQGHRWLIDQRLNEGKNVLICIRDVEPNEKNPWTAQEIEKMVHDGELKELIKDGRVITSIIPDIESINYGRVLEIMGTSRFYQKKFNKFLLQK